MLDKLVIPGVRNSLGVAPASTKDADYTNYVVARASALKQRVIFDAAAGSNLTSVKYLASPASTANTLTTANTGTGTTYYQNHFLQYQPLTTAQPIPSPTGPTGDLIDFNHAMYVQLVRNFEEVAEILTFYSGLFYVITERKFFRFVIKDSIDILYKITNQETFEIEEVEILPSKKILEVGTWLMSYSTVLNCYVAESKLEIQAKKKQSSVEKELKSKELLDSFNEKLKI